MQKTQAYPVVDIFAGPGGLGEGFSSVLGENDHLRFRNIISIEHDKFSYKALHLRHFYRSFFPSNIPEEYYGYLRGDIEADELFCLYPAQFEAANKSVLKISLGRRPVLDFVGSATIKASPATVAAVMRATLDFDLAAQRTCPTWTDALRLFIRQADEAGVFVMVSGVVMSNNHRRLNPAEFRGFALSDSLAPLIFVNGADTKAAQMFTLAHELAHIWLGASALSDIGAVPMRGFQQEEVWCNAVAAELLVPLDALRAELLADEPVADALPRLARTFKVSSLVILRRLLDANWLTRERFDDAWAQDIKRLRTFVQGGSGGGAFYRTTLARVSRRFARALVMSTLEGQTLYRDAFRMLGVSRTETFNNLGHEAGVKLR